MEIEQIIKRVDWLDDERRQDKNKLASIDDRLTNMEGNIPPISQQIKDLGGEITRLTAILSRMDRFDESLLQQRIEAKQTYDDLDRQVKKREEESEKVRRLELRGVEATIVELRKDISIIPELKRGIQARVEDNLRLEKEINDARVRIETIRHSEEEYTRAYRLLEDGRRQDAKRLTDLQGEVSALRKHIDDQRGKMELTTTTIRKNETRLSELSAVEVERREAQEKFLENQALLQMERERIWKEWQARFEVIEQQTSDIETNLQTLDTTHRSVKRSQAALDELSIKVDRRVNEMAEIQRLSEERFRQEWVTFKADDQKRWTNYTLTQEEQRGEIARQYEKLTDRVTQLEDNLQEIQDMLRQMNELTEKRLQSLLGVVHEWVTTYERSTGRVR
jgi:chromosome segregation ATPase